MTSNDSADTHVLLQGSRRYLRAGSQVLGRADPQEWVEVTVKVRRKADLPEPDPDHPISQAVLQQRYAADPADLDTVERVLTGFGLTTISKDAVAHAIKLAGPVSAMEQAFGTNLFRVKHADELYRGRTGNINIPRELDGIVTGVFGLDSRRMVRRRRPLALQAAHTLPPPNQRPWFLPQELAQAYQFPSGDGTGQSVGVVEFGGKYIASDLQQFQQLANLPAGLNPTVRNVHTLQPQDINDPDAIGEVMLDVQVLAGVCPMVGMTLYFSQWTEQGWVDVLDAIGSEQNPPAVVSISYALAEGDDIWTQQAIDQVNDSLKALANRGITVCVSSGDDGSDDQVGDGQAHVSFPPSSPYVLAVGGTSLVRATGDEIVWKEGDGVRRDRGGSTGGGVSVMNPRPSWQTVNIASVTPNAPAGRVVPDVAANAAGSTGYFMVAQGSPQVSGGTSAATPLWAGLLVRLIQSGKHIGFLPPRLYGPTANSGAQSLGAVGCRDITIGSNASGSAPGYQAGPGFDATTGWGSPKGQALLNAL
jgi:kumamolisin